MHDNDDYFSNATESSTILNASSGAYLYSRRFYLGVSVSNLLGLQNNDPQFEINLLQQKIQYYLSTGYTFNHNGLVGVKPSFLGRYQSEDRYSLGGGVQLLFRNLFTIGTVYGNDGWMSSMLNVRVHKSLEAGYIFDFASGSNMINQSSHELVISYSLDSFIKNNRNRTFGARKEKKDKTKSGIKSMRSF